MVGDPNTQQLGLVGLFPIHVDCSVLDEIETSFDLL